MTTSVKTCFKCGEEKPLDGFYVHPQMGDGHLNKCKECTKSDARATRQRRLAHYRAYDRQRGSRRTIEDQRRYREKNPLKTRAHQLVNYAVRMGKLKKQPCEVCGSAEVHAHHDDYGKPLKVRWLCAAHHHRWHAINGEAKVPHGDLPGSGRVATLTGG